MEKITPKDIVSAIDHTTIATKKVVGHAVRLVYIHDAKVRGYYLVNPQSGDALGFSGSMAGACKLFNEAK